KVQRPDGKIEVITLPEGVEYELSENGAFPAISLRATAKVDSVLAGKQAETAGFKKGDLIVPTAGEKVLHDEIIPVTTHNKEKEIELVVKRGGKEVMLNPTVGKDGTIGIIFGAHELIDKSKIRQINYGFGESIGRGISRGYTTLSDYVGQL